MPGHFYSFGQSRIHYATWGTGKRLLLCFHGYGESADSFALLEGPLGRDYTIIAIDFPFHGKTEWNEGLLFRPEDLLSILDHILETIPAGDGGWYLLGYSMGGRVALQLPGYRPEKIRKLVLMAPDGIRMNPWYRLATQTGPGNRLFRWTMRHPGWLHLLLRLGHALRLVNPSVHKFAVQYIGNEKVRQQLYLRWTVMRQFSPKIDAITRIIRTGGIPVSLLYGQYDRIVRWESGKAFLQKGIAGQSRLILLPTGHQLLHVKYLDILLNELTVPNDQIP